MCGAGVPPESILENAAAKIRELPVGSDWAGLAPHAPYSTSAESWIKRISSNT